MCEIINFNEYRRLKGAKRAAQTAKRMEGCRKPRVQELLTKEWAEEYMRSNWGLSKLIFHVIEKYGYIRCIDKKQYVFEDVKRDVRYCEMYPEIENKRIKAPLWVKADGEWYFVEMYMDSTGMKAFENKMAILGNYDIKGFIVDLSEFRIQKVKGMLEDNDLVGIVEKINDALYEYPIVRKTSSECKASVRFCGEEVKRDCIYKMLEQADHYAVLEGTELASGSKHLVLAYEEYEPKKYAKYFKGQYEKTGIPLLYAWWYKRCYSNWRTFIQSRPDLYKKLRV